MNHRIHLNKLIVSLTTALLTSVLYYAAFLQREGTWLLAWFAFVPLLIWLRNSTCLSAFCFSTLTGTIATALHIWWLKEIPGFPFISFAILAVYLGTYIGMFGLLCNLAFSRIKIVMFLFIPAAWVALEFARSNVPHLADPWSQLGVSQYQQLEVIQISTITSVYGISFLIMLINAALAEGIIFIYSHRHNLKEGIRNNHRVLISLTSSFTSLILVIIWGNYEIDKFHDLDSLNDKVIVISAIQPNIPQHEKWDKRFKGKILDQYRKITLKAAQSKPDLIIWPEAATPGYLRDDPLIFKTVKELIENTGLPILMGSSVYSKIIGGDKKKGKKKNSVFLLDRDGRIIGVYSKMILLPFGEYLPYEKQFPWPEWLVPKRGGFSPGEKINIFSYSGWKFGAIICWENMFSGHVRKFIKAGAQFIINPTNEALFNSQVASDQLLAMSVIRSVENRVSLIRCANTGITVHIDPTGKILSKVVDPYGKDINIQGILTTTIGDRPYETFYTKYGDGFAILCLAFTVLLILGMCLPYEIRHRILLIK